jgi:nucleotide-binding universal stress UspA family protein
MTNHDFSLSGKVLACVDHSPYAEAVCDFAAWSALRMEAPLSLLHVLDPGPEKGRGSANLSGAIGLGARSDLLEELATLDEQRARLAKEQGKHLLAAARARVAERGIEGVELRQRHGTLDEALLALDEETRLVVVGKRGATSASAHGHLGRNLERMIQTVTKPVLVAQQEFSPPTSILFAFDGSETALKGVERVGASPLFRGLPLHLVHVGRESPEIASGMKRALGVLEASGFQVTSALLEGSPEEALATYEARMGIDLMIMGAYGHSRVRRFVLGSTTTAMLRTSRISVMVLR